MTDVAVFEFKRNVLEWTRLKFRMASGALLWRDAASSAFIPATPRDQQVNSFQMKSMQAIVNVLIFAVVQCDVRRR